MEFIYMVISGLTCSLFTFFLMRGPYLNTSDLNMATATMGLPLLFFVLILIIISIVSKFKKAKKEEEVKNINAYINEKLKNTNFYIKKWSGKKGCFDVYRKDSNTLFLDLRLDSSELSPDEIVNIILEKIEASSKNKVLFSDLMKSLNYEDLSIAYIKTRLETDEWIENVKLDLIALKSIFERLQTVKANTDSEDICLLDHYTIMKDIYPYINLDNPTDFYIQFANSEYKEVLLESLCYLMEKIIVENKIKSK